MSNTVSKRIFGEKLKAQHGFTLMEVLVSTTIFAFAVVAVLALFNYALKINRRAEALRQASQGMRNMMELIAKEVRNGQVDYNASSTISSLCDNIYNNNSNKLNGQSWLGLVNVDSVRECFALKNNAIVYVKSGLGEESITPSNFKVNSLAFYVRPLDDPYAAGNTKVQPVVVVGANVTAQLPTGESVPIIYQTTVSTDKYDF